MRSLLIGLGHAAMDLHLPVLRRYHGRNSPKCDGSTSSIVGFDANRNSEDSREDMTVAASLNEAADLMDAADTVVHVCTPPHVRLDIVSELASRGFRHFLVEKPLAVDFGTVTRFADLQHTSGIRIQVIAPWLHSGVTERLLESVRAARMGSLRTITVVQNKPRLERTLTSASHTSALDVELPHSVGVALTLAGPGKAISAHLTDTPPVDGYSIPRMGAARLEISHRNEVNTNITSDLASPTQERRISLRFDDGLVVGHFPLSALDLHARLERVWPTGRVDREIFRDDALTQCIDHAYTAFENNSDTTDDFLLHGRVVTILDQARSYAEPPARSAVEQ